MDFRSSNSGLGRIVEKQLRNWEIRKAQVPQSPESARSRVQPYVAISRMVGSGGGRIAKGVHDRLGWPVIDQQILDYMAADDRTRRTLYDLMDERDLGMVSEMLLPVITGMPPKQQDYYRRLTEAALSIAQTESAIFLGRGIGYLLPGEVGVHIRIVASKETCLANYSQRKHLSEHQACVEFERVERERVHFLKSHFGEHALDLDRFDLVITTDRFAVDEAVNVILQLVETKIVREPVRPTIRM